MVNELTPRQIYEQLGLRHSPLLVDVRPERELAHRPRMIPGAVHFDPETAAQRIGTLPAQREIAVYSTGGEHAEQIASLLRHRGLRVFTISGGLERWLSEALPSIKVRPELGIPGNSQWVTRERPKIDRVACPWLVRRFIDSQAAFFYVPALQVRVEAQALGAQPYDIPDVTFSHRGANCSFDAFLDEFDLRDPVLDALARIVRAADTATLDQSNEAPGLLAISLGLSAAIRDDQVLLEEAMTLYDALYTWCKSARDESHSWPQKAVRQ